MIACLLIIIDEHAIKMDLRTGTSTALSALLLVARLMID
jgi:hypothetical protein